MSPPAGAGDTNVSRKRLFLGISVLSGIVAMVVSLSLMRIVSAKISPMDQVWLYLPW